MGRIEIYKGADGEFYYRVMAANGEIMASSEGYSRRSDALRGVEDLAEVFANDPLPITFEEA